VSEQFKTVLIDPVARPSLDVGKDRSPSGIVHIATRATRGTDHVMVVANRLARDVRMPAGRQVQAFDRVKLDERIQRPEDRRPSDAKVSGLRVVNEVRRRERPLPSRD
jgi:hypothetical protein